MSSFESVKKNMEVLGSYGGWGRLVLVFWGLSPPGLFRPLPPPRLSLQEVLLMHMLPFAFLSQDRPASLATWH